MKSSVSGLLAWGQAGFLVCLTICLVLVPSYLHSEGGVSNYGTLRRTVVFYSLAFVSAVVSNIVAGRRVAKQNVVLARNLYILAVLFTFVLLSTYPYKLNDTWRLIHELAGISLFTFETGFSVWLCLGLARHLQNLLSLSLLLVFLVGALISFMTLVGLTHLLFIGQAITAVGFAGLLVSCTRNVSAVSKKLLEN